jgi:hypothetical protein
MLAAACIRMQIQARGAPPGARALSRLAPERVGEMRLMREAAGERDLRQREPPFGQQPLRTLATPAHHIAARSQPGLDAEGAREMERREPRRRGHAAERDLLAEPLLDMRRRASQRGRRERMRPRRPSTLRAGDAQHLGRAGKRRLLDRECVLHILGRPCRQLGEQRTEPAIGQAEAIWRHAARHGRADRLREFRGPGRREMQVHRGLAYGRHEPALRRSSGHDHEVARPALGRLRPASGRHLRLRRTVETQRHDMLNRLRDDDLIDLVAAAPEFRDRRPEARAHRQDRAQPGRLGIVRLLDDRQAGTKPRLRARHGHPPARVGASPRARRHVRRRCGSASGLRCIRSRRSAAPDRRSG